MKIARIRTLIEQYEQNIMDNTLSVEAIDLLLNPETFAQSPEDFETDLLLEGENYSPREAMQIFVLKIVSTIDAASLYQLIEKMIARTTPVSNASAFLQQPSLIKHFFAYIRNNQPEKPNSALDFANIMELWFAKLNLTTSCKNAVIQSINKQSLPFESIIKNKNPESLDAIAAEVVTLTTEKPGLTALDFGPFTPTAPATNPYILHQSASEKGLLEFDPLTIFNAITRDKAKHNSKLSASTEKDILQAQSKAKRANIDSGPLSHTTNSTKSFDRFMLRQVNISCFVNELTKYAAHYSKPSVQIHQAIFYPEKQKKSVLQAQLKAKVANEFILYLRSNNRISIIQNKFATLLQDNKLSAEDFFTVSKDTIKLSEELQKVLSPTTAYTNSKKVTDVTTNDQADIQPTTKETKKLFGGFGNMFSSSSASTASDNPNASFIAELDKYIAHYGSATTQLSQLAFHSKDKRTSTGKLESVAKTDIANGIKLALENQESNIPERFTALLTENGLAHNPDAFFEGTKEKVKPSAALETLLKGETKAPGMTLSAAKEEV